MDEPKMTETKPTKLAFSQRSNTLYARFKFITPNRQNFEYLAIFDFDCIAGSRNIFQPRWSQIP